MTVHDYIKKHPKIDKGEKMVFKCIECNNEQIGYSKLDGFRREKCDGYIIPCRWVKGGV